MGKVKATLLVTLSTEFEDNESDAEMVRFCVEQDLQDEGYEVDSVEVFEG